MASGKLNFFMEDIDYPREELYSAIEEIFAQRSFVITPQILRTLEPGIKDGLILLPSIDRSFVRVLLKLEQMEKVIQWAVTEEVANANKRDIFRENSLASHLVVWTFRIAGEEFLIDTLRDFVMDLLNSSENLEIDPVILEASGDLNKNTQALTSWTMKLVNKLCASIKNIPPVLINIIGIIQKIIMERFKDEPDNKEITRNVIMNFLILRYISLALVSPAEYDLIRPSMLKNSRQKRNLVLLTKMITSIAYGNHFRSSFEVMNRVVDSLAPRFQTIYTELSSAVKTGSQECSVCDYPNSQKPTISRNFSELMGDDVSMLIKYFQMISIDKVVVESLNIFYKHIIENTGVYSVPEMMEMLTCFSKLKWIARTDWFTEKAVRTLSFPKTIQRVLDMMANRERLNQEYIPSVTDEMNVTEWFHRQYPKYRFTIYVFYRGFFCTGCKKWLAEWNDLVDVVRKTGGNIFAITSESASSAKSTKQKWNLKFDVVSDQNAILAETNNISIEDPTASGWALLGDYGSKFSQPGVLCLNKEGSVVYFWKQHSTAANIFGGTGRVVPVEAVVSILEAVNFDDKSNEVDSYGSLSDSSSVDSSKNSNNAIAGVDQIAAVIVNMNKVEIHKLITTVVKEDETAVNIYEEVMNQKKNIKESEKRIKKEKKLEKKSSQAHIAKK